MPVKCYLSCATCPTLAEASAEVHCIGGGFEAVKGEGMGPSHTWVYTLIHHLLAMWLRASDPPSPSPCVWD